MVIGQLFGKKKQVDNVYYNDSIESNVKQML